MIKFDNTYSKLPSVFYSKAAGHSTPLSEVVMFNKDLANELDLSEDFLISPEGAALLSANAIPDDAAGIAMAYAGHQFGQFTMLGDGRALLLGEVISRDSRRFDLHLKGSGATAYSRRGDGKAALGPMLREYLISEAMHGLGIPTSRSLAVLRTGEWIQRERLQKGAVLVRVAESHIRVGTFQYAMALTNRDAAHLPSLKRLAEYAIERHYPLLLSADNPILTFYETIIARQAALVAQWQQVGFIHGVLNTDNTAISGETIDYGPCAFMDIYHPETVFSSIDQNGRYAYGQQPYIIGWNLARLGETLLVLLDDDPDRAHALADSAYKKYAETYQRHYYENFSGKLGFLTNDVHRNSANADSTSHVDPQHQVNHLHEVDPQYESHQNLIDDLLNLMLGHQLDFTETFVYLTLMMASTIAETADDPINLDSASALTDRYAPRYATLNDWILRWQEALAKQGCSTSDTVRLMMAHNPCVIPRNVWVEEALSKCEVASDYRRFNDLLSLLKNPNAYSEEQLGVAFRTDEEVKAQASKPRFRTFCGT